MDLTYRYQSDSRDPLNPTNFENFEFNKPVLDPHASEATSLTDLEIRILDFERQWWRYAGMKDAGIREQFGMNAAQYYEALNNLIDREDALAAYPLLVKRLRRLREARLASRLA